MLFEGFHTYFPEIAEKETRSFSVLNDLRLPRGSYSLIEQYCEKPNCDCRRVFFSVFSSHSNRVEAVISYGWETSEFYAQWMGDDDPETVRELQGPILNPLSPQSDIAPAILKRVQDIVLRDQAYIERLKEHYGMFKNHIEKTKKRSRKKRKRTKKRRR